MAFFEVIKLALVVGVAILLKPMFGRLTLLFACP
jgi:hypothetical protein